MIAYTMNEFCSWYKSPNYEFHDVGSQTRKRWDKIKESGLIAGGTRSIDTMKLERIVNDKNKEGDVLERNAVVFRGDTKVFHYSKEPSTQYIKYLEGLK